MTEEFVKVTAVGDLVENKGITRKLDDDDIALVKLDGEIVAFINICPHQHTSLVDKYGGQIAGDNLTCPMHGWTYNLKTGECVNVPACDLSHSNEISMASGKSGKLRMLEVKVEGRNVFVRKLVRNPNW